MVLRLMQRKQTFDKLVAATPADQRNVWSGMESCFGRVCTGAGNIYHRIRTKIVISQSTFVFKILILVV